MVPMETSPFVMTHHRFPACLDAFSASRDSPYVVPCGGSPSREGVKSRELAGRSNALTFYSPAAVPALNVIYLSVVSVKWNG